MHNKFNTLVLASMISMGLSGCVVSVGNHTPHNGQSASATFGNIEVNDGESAGELEAVNGNVEIGANARVNTVEVTNGNIQIDDMSEAKSLETVNGNIEAGKEVMVGGNVETVNGNIEFEQGAKLSGNVETVNGDIRLAAGATISGNIIFNKPGSWLGRTVSKTPKLILGEGVTVEGQIQLYRPVDLTLPDSIDPGKVNRHYNSGE